MLTERLAILVSANVDDAVRGLRKVEQEADKSLGNAERRIERVGANFRKAGAVMLTAGGLAAAGLWKAGQAASDLEQAVGGSEAVFGDAINIIDDFAATSAQSFGLSQRAARELTSQLGAMLKGFGFTREEAAETSVTLAQLGSDLSAAFGGSPEDAVSALGAAMRGERDPIERYGVSLTAASVEQRALEMGLAATKGEIDANAKAQASLSLIMEQTTDIQGQFARESDTAAGQQARLKASVEDLTAAIGEGVLPIMRDGIGLINGVVGAFNALPGPIQSTISKMAVAGTGFLLVGGAASSAVGNLIGMSTTLRGLPTRMQGASRATRALASAGAALAVVGVAYALDQWSSTIGKTTWDMERLSQATGDQLVEAYQLAAALENADGLLGKHGLAGSMEMFTELAESDAAAAGELRDALVRLGEDAEPLDAVLADVAERNARAAVRAEENAEAIDEVTDASNEAGPALGGLSGSLYRTEEAAKKAEEAQRELFDAMDAVIDEAFGGLDALANWEEALDEVADAARENGATLDLTTDAGRRNHRNLRDLVEAGHARIQQLIDEGASTDDVRAAQRQMADQLSATAGELGFTARQAQNYRDALLNIPTSVTTRLLLQQVNAVGTSTTKAVRARGGPVLAGRSYLVGEEGPEVLTMAGSGYVHPNGSNSMSAAMSAGSMIAGGGSQTINLVVDGRVLASVVRDQNRDYVRHGGRLA